MRAATVEQKMTVIRSGLVVLGFPVAFVMIFCCFVLQPRHVL